MQHDRPALGALFALVAVMPAVTQAPAPELRLYGQMSGTDTFLVDQNGTTVHTWPSQRLPGLAVYLADNGDLLRTINTGSPSGTTGGSGGGLQRHTLNGSLIWDFRYSGNGVWSHHDIEELPNGNVLMIAWEDKTRNEAIAAGRNPAWAGSGVFRPDHVVEVMQTGPTTGSIVWEWHLWDHLVQDFDNTRANFGVVADHPELVDLNYPAGGSSGDWNHCNGIDYDPVHDWIVISCRNNSEIWVIDHSTTTQEAAGHTGGNYGMGGDLIYRWGNPEAYGRGNSSNRTLFQQHSANFIAEGYPGAGNMLYYNNLKPGGAAAEEIVLPLDPQGRFILQPGQPYGPAAPIWSVGAATSQIVSSARRARNGNTLICSGSQGRVVEVDPLGTQVWSTSLFGSVFHAHYVDRDLWANRTTLSAASGGTVSFNLIAGGDHAGDLYLVLGSGSGTTPGLTLNGQELPLNFDAYFGTTISSANTLPFTETFGVLNANGRSGALFTLPPGLTFLVGLHLDHAFLTFDPITFQATRASNAVPLDVIQ